VKVEALDSFTGDWPGRLIFHFRKGQTEDVPDWVAELWIGRGLVKEAVTTDTQLTQADGDDNGE